MNSAPRHIAATAAAALAAGPAIAQDKFVFACVEEPPFATTINGQPAGSDVEVAKTVLARTGIKDVELRKGEFADLLPGVAAGRWTMDTGLFVTPERCKAGTGLGAVTFSRENGVLVAWFSAESARFLGSDERRAIVEKYGFGPDEITPTLTAKSEDLCK